MVAVVDDIFTALQTIQNFQSLQANMRSNAVAYKAAVVAGKDIPTLVAVIKADAQLYLTRINWVTGDPAVLASLKNGLTALTVDPAVAASVATQLTNVANAQLNATLVTGADITTAANQLLAAVTAPKSIWPI